MSRTNNECTECGFYEPDFRWELWYDTIRKIVLTFIKKLLRQVGDRNDAHRT